MTSVSEFFSRHIIEVYFIYGLSFFSMGLAIALELGHSSELDFARALKPLAAFGFLHGIHEWFEMYLLIHPNILTDQNNTWIVVTRLLLLSASFLMLVFFGARMIAGPGQRTRRNLMVGVIVIIWGLGLLLVITRQPAGVARTLSADVYTRYSLAIPGAALAAWGLILQRRRFIEMGMYSFGRDVFIAAIAFLLYGCVGQLFASPSLIFPSEFLNQDVFVRTFGVPVQVFRAAMACTVAVFIIRSLRAFEVESRQQMEELREAQYAERSRLEETRAELLHRTVIAQENERQRIARELHDETGQTLTALGLGLRGLSGTINQKPDRAIEQAEQLEQMAIVGLDELQRMVTGLRPPLLDDLGLIPALRWYAQDVSARYHVQVEVIDVGNAEVRSPDLRVALFRITQEAVTNAIRHANPSKVLVRLEGSTGEIILRVIDDGIGFDVDQVLNKAGGGVSWGLFGMMERATLAGGICELNSSPGGGTIVSVRVNLKPGVEDG